MRWKSYISGQSRRTSLHNRTWNLVEPLSSVTPLAASAEVIWPPVIGKVAAHLLAMGDMHPAEFSYWLDINHHSIWYSFSLLCQSRVFLHA